MPLMDGIDTTKKLKEICEKKYIYVVVIACTAFTDSKTILNCQKVGVDYYLKKPLTKNVLLNTLVDAIVKFKLKGF